MFKRLLPLLTLLLMMSGFAIAKAPHGSADTSTAHYLANEGLMSILDVGEAFWQDIDTPEMLAHAELILNCASFSASQK